MESHIKRKIKKLIIEYGQWAILILVVTAFITFIFFKILIE